ncbi:MAG: DUF503 domain-containing protein [Proteobacteria bacterium]|nr:DUF503 domain-containing protein [Pseudomonadota bacterium]
MFVGVCRLTFQLFDVHSLKMKRSVVNRLLERTRAKFDISIAEVADNDRLSQAVLSFVVVGNAKPHVDAMMGKVGQFMEEMAVAPLLRRQTEIISFGDEMASDEVLGTSLLDDMSVEDFQ